LIKLVIVLFVPQIEIYSSIMFFLFQKQTKILFLSINLL
jgi:hypothetical protein